MAQMNQNDQQKTFTIDHAQQYIEDYSTWGVSYLEPPCEHIAQCADGFARSKGFENTEHLNSLYDSLYHKPEPPLHMGGISSMMIAKAFCLASQINLSVSS